MNEIKTGVFEIIENNSIYIIGDIHGDYQCLIHCLVDLCGVASIKSIIPNDKFGESNREHLEWEESNNSIIVFCGDLIHRKRFPDTILDDECSDIFIIKTLLRLKESAKKNNGDILIVSGNHEIMNIVDPDEIMYTSDKNLEFNNRYFKNSKFVNNYISNSYAWIKINNILIAHGGLCSDYLKFLDNEDIFKEKIFKGGSLKKNFYLIGGEKISFGNDIISYINDKYRSFFTDYNNEKSQIDPIGFKLFIEYDFHNKHNHNIFWCREWGYSGINCEDFKKLVNKVDCSKMIIAHCPQFLSNDKPKMINFECISNESLNQTIQDYNIARVDLGMSRSFEYNKQDNFLKYLAYNHNRKMSVLKILKDPDSKYSYFNYDSVITNKLSCIQYLLIKYGKTQKEWEANNISSDWIGFKYTEDLIKLSTEEIKDNLNKCNDDETRNIILCLLYPLYFNNSELKSVREFNSLNKKN